MDGLADLAEKRVIIHADGVSRGNPGPAAIGATVADEAGRRLAEVSQRIGLTTNNQAEYRALIAALKEAFKLGATQASVFLDSELVVKHLNGKYRVKKDTLKPLYREAAGLLARFTGFTLKHVPRAQNAEADRLANAAFD